MPGEENTIKVEVNLDDMTIDDLETIDQFWARKETGEGLQPGDITKLINLFDNVIVGGVRGRGLKLGDFEEIVDQVMTAITGMGDRKNSASG